MKRTLAFESLDSRICFALGDIVTDFAQTGEYSISYPISESASNRIVDNFAMADGQLIVGHTYLAGGVVYTLIKLNNQGQLDTNFGNGGTKQFIDPHTPNSVIVQAVSLSDGRILLRAQVNGWYQTLGVEHSNLIAIRSDGSLDTGFADSGFLRLDSRRSNPLSIVPDRDGGFYVLGNPTPGATTALTRYGSSGLVDQSFGQAGTISVSRLSDPRAFVDASDRVLLWGNPIFTTDLQSLRFLKDGSPDATYGTSGVVNAGSLGSAIATLIADDGESLWRLGRSVNGDRNWQVTKLSADYRTDLAFGTNGTFTVPYDAFSGTNAVKLLALPGEEILLAFSHTESLPTRQVLTAVKITADGQLDSSYGLQGISEQTIPRNTLLDRIAHDGRGGIYWVNIFGLSNAEETLIASHTLANGSADTQFGNAGRSEFQIKPNVQGIWFLQLDPILNGRMRVQSGWPTGLPRSGDLGQAVTLDNKGNVVATSAFGSGRRASIVVSTPSSDGGWYIAQNDLETSPTPNRQLLVYKYQRDGTIDTRFGSAGKMTIDTSEISRIFIRNSEDGSVVIVADAWPSTSDPVNGITAILRLKSDGSPDTAFGPSGLRRLFSRPGQLVDVQIDDQSGILLVHQDYLSPTILRRLTIAGQLDSQFGVSGQLQVGGSGEWKATAIDEEGRLLVVVQESAGIDFVYKLTQWTASGKAIATFGTGGSLTLPIKPSLTLPNFALAVRRGLIVLAATHESADSRLRLVAVDYAGQFREEIGAGGVRDYELSTDGETVADLTFADDGSLWLGTYERDGLDMVGNVIKLEGTTVPPLHNWSQPLDVNLDFEVTPLDALIVISILNGMQSPANMMPDVNNDARITPLDALQIINQLNSLGSAEGEPAAERPAIAFEDTSMIFSLDMLADITKPTGASPGSPDCPQGNSRRKLVTRYSH